jgi:peptidoglycan/LPS O-acetylase OafA/YrhL
MPNKAQYFALGIASAVVVRGGSAALRFYGAALCACMALSGAQGGLDKLLPPLIWTCCLAAQLRTDSAMLRPLAKVLSSRALVWLGAISYCIYLVNEPVQKLLGVGLAVLTGGDAVLFSTFWLPAALALPMLAAWGLHEWIEVPALRRGRALARRGMAAVPVNAA